MQRFKQGDIETQDKNLTMRNCRSYWMEIRDKRLKNCQQPSKSAYRSCRDGYMTQGKSTRKENGMPC